MNTATTNFYITEALEVHRLCDLSDVPRVSEDGSLLSMSQRVEILQTVTDAVMRSIGQNPPTRH